MVVTPWRHRLLIDSSDHTSSALAVAGVHELAVTEAMWRLADEPELAIDAGANVGYFTSLLACRARRVIAFEPNPDMAARLAGNTARWGVAGTRVDIEARALSDGGGTASLRLPPGYERHSGGATLEPAAAATVVEVPVVRLDDILGDERAGVVKLDVEGHEAAVLRGASRALETQQVRDVFFEEHGELPSSASQLLTDAGYSLFGLDERLLGIDLVAPAEADHPWGAPVYLATADSERAARRLKPRGWCALNPRLEGLIMRRAR
jgi:FkbM family methyltransferase